MPLSRAHVTRLPPARASQQYPTASDGQLRPVTSAPAGDPGRGLDAHPPAEEEVPERRCSLSQTRGNEREERHRQSCAIG
eukprot:scaffold6507_cov240-Isochrysis_galbana.AAC.5